MINSINGTGIVKMYSISVHIFDAEFGRAMTKFLDLNLMEGSSSATVATIFEHVDAVLRNL